jgi:hypothetical protein
VEQFRLQKDLSLHGEASFSVTAEVAAFYYLNRDDFAIKKAVGAAAPAGTYSMGRMGQRVA